MKLSRGENNLLFLDGLRGLSILLVIFFHAYSKWVDLVPYGSSFATIPVFKFGNFGVFLFFLISGFVILMSLERCDSYWHFLKKRWLRLFPAMLFISIFVFFTAALFWERPAGLPIARDILPGVTFIHPFLWGQILGGQQGMLEGAFWTIYVEVFFYLIFGFIFFIAKRWAILILATISMIGLLFRLFTFLGLLESITLFSNILGLQFFCWFTTGALAYLYFKTKLRHYLMLYALSGVLTSLSMMGRSDFSNSVAAAFVLVVFILPFLYELPKKVFASKILVFLGFISYPLYLIHENMMISLIIKIGKVQNYITGGLIPVLPILLIIFIAYIVARYIEPAIRGCIVKSFIFFKRRYVRADNLIQAK